MFDHILVAIDGSEPAQKALDTAKALAHLSEGNIRVLHVREHGFAGRAGEVEFEDHEHAHAMVDAAVTALETAGLKASGTVRGARHSHVAREILEEASEVGADIVIMGALGRSELSELLIGSTTHKVLHLSTLPVVIAR